VSYTYTKPPGQFLPSKIRLQYRQAIPQRPESHPELNMKKQIISQQQRRHR